MQNVYILHGWSYDISKWKSFLKVLKKHNVTGIILKIPGLTAKIENVWEIDDYIEWLTGRLKLEKKIIIIGHSNGGRIALNFALNNPNKIKKLFLIDSAGILDNSFKIRLKRHLFKNVAIIGKHFTNSNFWKDLLYKFTGETDYNNASPIMKKTMQNLISNDLRSVLLNIHVDTHIIWGQDDEVTPLKDGILMNKLIKDSKMDIISGAKHSPQFTHPEEVAKIIYENI